jgi:hypothetical protein
MITIILISISFVGGVYVGARWAEKLRDIYHSLTGK